MTWEKERRFAQKEWFYSENCLHCTHLVGLSTGGSVATMRSGDEAAPPPLAVDAVWRGAARGPAAAAAFDRDGTCTLLAMFNPAPEERDRRGQPQSKKHNRVRLAGA